MLLNRMREDIHDFCLKLRMLDRILETQEFEEAYEAAVDFRMLKLGIENLDLDTIKFFISMNKDPEELSMRELRRVSRQYNIAFWSRLSREELLKEVIDAGQHSRAREIDRQVDILSDIGGDQTSDADGTNPLAGCAIVSRRIGLYSISADAATVASRIRRERLSARRDVAEHGDDGNHRTSGTEDTGQIIEGPSDVLAG